MKKALFVILAAMIIASPAWAKENSNNIKLETPDEKINYALGLDLGQRLRDTPLELNTKIINRGLKDSAQGVVPLLTPKEVQEALTLWRERMRERAMSDRARVSAMNRTTGMQFLEEYRTRPGVTVTPEGLMYKVLKDGGGASPGNGDTVLLKYKATLIDGTVVGDTLGKDKPEAFPVAEVIRAWQVALPLMKVGSKWEVVASPDLCYGPSGAPPAVPSNATLIYELELVDIQAK